MAEIDHQRLKALLTDPRETLAIEYKSWLDLSQNEGKAILAKAAIALANHGGGTIVLGMREDESDKAVPKSKRRPRNIALYDVAVVNAAINRFADPKLDCEVEYANHPDTNEEHVFVIIPGNVPVPVMSARDSGEVIKQQTCYIRKPGPKSEPPYTSEEWRKLLNRCVLANRDTMLDAIRGIVDGQVAAPQSSPTNEDKLVQFASESKDRWQERIKDLPQSDVARLSSGFYEVTFALLGIEDLPNLTKVRSLIDDASKLDRTGYGPFWYGSRESHIPQIIGDAVEAWQGDPTNNVSRNSMDVSFWRASKQGQFYYIEGHYEDSGYQHWQPGVYFDMSYSIRRFARFFQFAAHVAQLSDGNSQIQIALSVSGLQGRRLMSDRIWVIERHGLISSNNAKLLGPKRFTSDQIQDNLEEILHDLLFPLYEQFSFYKLKREFVAAEIDLLRKRGY